MFYLTFRRLTAQVGFTTEERDGRSTHYCTDVAKVASLPTIHVNGECIDQVLLVSPICNMILGRI